MKYNSEKPDMTKESTEEYHSFYSNTKEVAAEGGALPSFN